MSSPIATLTDAHLSWLELRRRPGTVAYYRFAYGRRAAFVETGAAPPRLGRGKSATADRFATWLGGAGVKPVTVRRYVCALVTLCRWAHRQDYLAKDPLAG